MRLSSTESLINKLKSDTGSSTFAEAEVVLQLNSSDCEEQLPINIRPYFKECLKEVKHHYQVIVFTASKKYYADTILNFLDPQEELIEARFYRESC